MNDTCNTENVLPAKNNAPILDIAMSDSNSPIFPESVTWTESLLRLIVHRF